jgi:O-antigen/teichoic acid export membrane protein
MELGSFPPPSTLALVGAKWVSLGALLQRAFRLGAAILLARLLVPGDFGVFAVVSVTVDALSVLKEMGMPTALIRLRSGVHQAASTFFYLSIASAGVICSATWIAAPQFAEFVGSPVVTPVMRAMVFKIAFESASIVQRTLAVRELSLRAVTEVALMEAAVGSSLSIVLAALGFGVWSLAWGTLGGSAVSAIVWWRLSTWRPAGRPSPGAARQLIGFGANVSGSAVIEGATEAVTRALVGRGQGVAGLGYLDLALRMAVVPVRGLTVAVGQQVAVPAMCLVQRDLGRMASWYLAALGALSAATAPLAACLVAIPELLVVGIFGSQWAPAVPLVRLLGPTVFILPLAYARPVYVATGRVDLLLRLSLLQLTLTMPAVYVAVRAGLEAVCAVQVGAFAVVAAVNVAVVRRLLALGWNEIARALRVPLEGAAVLALVLVSLRAWLHPQPTLWSIATVATPGLLAYAALVRLRQPELVAGLLGAARRASASAAAG